jgi:hypothetical protein
MGDLGNPLDQATMEMQRWEWEGGRVMTVEGPQAFNASLQEEMTTEARKGNTESAKRADIDNRYANAAAAAARAGDTDAAREIPSDFAAVADVPNPWTDLIAAARAQVRRAEGGNRHVARGVLRQAAVALRDVLGIRDPNLDAAEQARKNTGTLPDPERKEYLLFLLTALEQIDAEVEADKALGLWSGNRPTSVSDDRDLVLFFNVGDYWLAARNKAVSVDAAITAVAKSRRLGKPTVQKAWKKHGGLTEWKKEYEEAPNLERKGK